MKTYSKSEFSRFFRQKYWRLLRAALNRHEQRPKYSDPKVIEDILVPYRKLAVSDDLAQVLPGKRNIPPHVWILWQQGWDKAPPLVRACARSWQQMNPDWKVHLVDENTISDFAPAYAGILAPNASRTARSNIARLSLLQQNGGVWADSTLFCQQPLDEWLPKVWHADFFMFSEPRPYRYSDIWFLASAPGTHLISSWLDMVGQYWGYFRRPHHYYWMEYLFELLVSKDAKVAANWRQVPRLCALGPLIVQGLPFERNVPQNTIDAIEQKTVPLHKLSHKWRYSGDLRDTPVGILTGLEYLRQ